MPKDQKVLAALYNIIIDLHGRLLEARGELVTTSLEYPEGMYWGLEQLCTQFYDLLHGLTPKVESAAGAIWLAQRALDEYERWSSQNRCSELCVRLKHHGGEHRNSHVDARCE